MAFSQPGAGGDTFNAADHNGHLLIVYPKSYQDEVDTKNGKSSAADVDIVICDKFDATGKPVVFINARLFGNLARSVRNDIGGQVLGRLGQGPNTRGTPPWILANFTDQDMATATPIDAAYRQGVFAPTPAATPPAQYGAPATAPPQQWQGGAATQPPATAPPTAPAAAQWTPPTAAPAPASSAPPAAQWQQQAAPAAPQGYGATPSPAPQQWQAPPASAPAAPAPAPASAAPAPVVDPNLVAWLASKGINLQPGTTQADAEAIAASVPQ